MAPCRRRWLVRPVLLLAFGYACWLGMEVTHEAGHALHAAVSGGRVVRVDLPAAGFSRTDVSPNPHPAFVARGRRTARR